MRGVRRVPVRRVDEVYERVRGQIEAGRLEPGERLPPIRGMADEMRISRNSVVQAYERLVADSLVVARRGSGFYVAHALPRMGERTSQSFREATDAISLLREQLDRNFDARIGDGRPPAGWLEASELQRYFRFGISVRSGTDYGYGEAAGYMPLRRLIARRLEERGIAAGPDTVFTTFGANHAFDLITRQYLSRGDCVLVDEPGYYPLFAKLRLAGVRLIGVRRLPDGPDIEDLARKIARHRPRGLFTQTVAHNPTGTTTSPEKCAAVLQLAGQGGLFVVEDDTFADLVPPGTVRLASLPSRCEVIHVGTFSKTLSASLRSGFVSAPPEVVRQLVALKMLGTVATSSYIERFIFELIDAGQYASHLRRLGQRVSASVAQTAAALRATGFGLPFGTGPGYYLYPSLPEGVSEADIAHEGAEAGIFIAPGSVFSPGGAAGPAHIRVNVAYGTDAAFHAFARDLFARGGHGG
ncbi:PLP-dependent aminotransferase family protein [Paroceanicella profunda]|uniref:aminotransferase-like domain-containing protein n=1 Tax=Paroceanicella profunda TaxID=2579971 RepID=UPI001EF15C8E|nr:PLP-dependent aminotransferase family protein [Paroceanicella profunda]